MIRVVLDPGTRACVEKRRAEGTTKRKIRRIRKHALARSIHRRPQHRCLGWTPAAVDEWISDVFWPNKGHEAVIRAQLKATDDRSAEAILHTIMRNLLRDEARKTTTSKLLEQLNGVTTERDDLAAAAAHTGGVVSWTLPHFGDAVHDGDWTDLLHAPGLRSPQARSPQHVGDGQRCEPPHAGHRGPNPGGGHRRRRAGRAPLPRDRAALRTRRSCP